MSLAYLHRIRAIAPSTRVRGRGEVIQRIADGFGQATPSPEAFTPDNDVNVRWKNDGADKFPNTLLMTNTT